MPRDMLLNEARSILGVERSKFKEWVLKGWIKEHGFNGVGQPFFWSEDLKEARDKLDFCCQLSLNTEIWPLIDTSNKDRLNEVGYQISALLRSVLKQADLRQGIIQGNFNPVLPSKE